LFNLLKFIGINYDEIIGKKDLWPFKIYKNEITNRPYIKVEYNGQKEKIFYFEDILSMFLQKLFEQFFKKIIIKNNKNMKLYLQLGLPNYLNYLQKKIIEKIFQNNIFSNNILYNGCNVILEQIKLENATNVMCLYNELGNVNNYEKNILCIFIDRCSINLSIINKKRMLYEVKGIESAGFGEEDFIDNFVYDCLKEFDENIYKECISTPGALAKLRRSCSIAQKYFDKNSQIEIKVSKLYGTIDLKMILTKSDYEKACNDLFKKINLLIKEILKKSKLSEINIDNILLIGSMSRSDKIKNILKELFKHNRLLYNKLSSSLLYDNDNDYYLVIGAALQAANLIIEEPKYIISDITPMSFGVETINGLMEFVVEKGVGVPVQKEKFIKIKNDGEKFLEIKIYEGEDINVNKNRLISSANIDKRNFKMEKMGKDFIEILIQFEIDSNLNLCVYVLDVKTFKRRFECLINIDIVKN
jgi:molecular chaperone DnaK